VARDRQRAKQRRRQRQPGSGGPGSGSGRTRPRDVNPPAPEPTDAELDSTAAPEPTEQAFPYVEEAQMAETGVDAEAESAQPTDPAVLEERAAARRPRKQRGKIITFLGHVVDELRRVQWPDRRQTGQGTAVTLGFVVVAGGFLGAMDALWKPLVDWLI
jgi:preprotein translocase SecE subunit